MSSHIPAPQVIDRNVAVIRQHYKGKFPKIALVLGSGWDRFGDKMTLDCVIPYDHIPDFPTPTVLGHKGRLLIGTIEGSPIVCMAGRTHLYEGYSAQEITLPIRALKRLGVETIILTNAAGSLHKGMPAGSIMTITDHVNMSGNNPLIGPNDDAIGPRFFDMTEAYDLEMRNALTQSAKILNIDLHHGVYVQVLGPNFETPAEIRLFSKLGLDAVGMSTVQECLAARHCGIKVVGISLITNLAAGLSPNPLSHEEIFVESQKAFEKVSHLLIHFITTLSNEVIIP